MALGRAEKIYEETRKPVSICRIGGYPRRHEAWIGNPAWYPHSLQKIIDGGGERPYIKYWRGRQIIFNDDYRARAGKVHLTQEEKSSFRHVGPFAVVAPFLKDIASVNKNWGAENFERVIDGFGMPVYQLTPDFTSPVIKGAERIWTPTFRRALAVIRKASVVLCNEGGTHHMAASMRVPAVVIFGTFIPPKITGYDFHTNIAVETEHGFCGRFDYCAECADALKSITPDRVRAETDKILGR